MSNEGARPRTTTITTAASQVNITTFITIFLLLIEHARISLIMIRIRSYRENIIKPQRQRFPLPPLLHFRWHRQAARGTTTAESGLSVLEEGDRDTRFRYGRGYRCSALVFHGYRIRNFGVDHIPRYLHYHNRSMAVDLHRHRDYTAGR